MEQQLKLAQSYCQACGAEVHVIGMEYTDGPERYDGISEWVCTQCGRREGRWTGRVLQEGDVEPRYGGVRLSDP